MVLTATVLLLLWVLALMTGNALGGLTHVLVVIAVVLFIIRMSQGQSPLRRG